MKKAEMKIEQWPIAKLKPYGNNPRDNDQAVERMVASIKEFGFTVPVLALKNGEVVDGHLRLKAAVVLELATVPVIVCNGWSKAQVKAFRLLVNRSVTWAGWDMDKLGAELLELKAMDFNLALTGFDPLELGDLSSIEFKEFIEDAANDVKYVDCPKCGEHFPA